MILTQSWFIIPRMAEVIFQNIHKAVIRVNTEQEAKYISSQKCPTCKLALTKMCTQMKSSGEAEVRDKGVNFNLEETIKNLANCNPTSLSPNDLA